MVERIALTGATGFVGRVVVDQLVAQGKTISALVRNAAKANLHPSVRIVEGDLANPEALAEVMRGAEVILHIAGTVSGISQTSFLDANTAGTLAVVAAAHAQKLKRLVFVSSLAATQPELNFYGESKAKAEAVLTRFAGVMNIAIIRPAAIYGPGDTATLPLLQALMSRIAIIPGSPTAQFSMVHVDDVARGLVDAALNKVSGVFEIDDGSNGYCWPDLVAIVQTHFGVPRRVLYLPKSTALFLGRLGDRWASYKQRPALLNSGQMKQIYHPDWRVKGQRLLLSDAVKLQDGLPQTIRWYQAQGMLPMREVKARSGPSQRSME
jgi:nucleoside-diphosphate-sugar epimerase